MVCSFRMRRITDITQVVDGFTALFFEKDQGPGDDLSSSVAVGHNTDDLVWVWGSHMHFVRHYAFGCNLWSFILRMSFAFQASLTLRASFIVADSYPPGAYLKLITQLSGFRKHEMNNPLALCELAAWAPNISARYIIKQTWPPKDRFYILDIF